VQLENRTVIVYGATVPQGIELAHRYGRDHALVYVADLHQTDAETLAHSIVAGGGFADASEVDLLNLDEVRDYTAELAGWNGGIDIAVVAIRPEHKVLQLPIARTVAGHMTGDPALIVLVIAELDAGSPEFHEFEAAASAAGVSVRPVLVSR
jgi:NAD(P)-dependent dehydrogenase (short-subunit alcohol dehydrogenase family)